MDPASLAISVVTLSSVFQTCLAAYGCVTDALAIGDTALGLEIRFRVEAMRIRLWGESQGLGFVTDPSRARRNPSMDIREIRRLILDILGRIVQLLEKHMYVTKKYNLEQSKHAGNEDGNSTLSLPDILSAKDRLDQRIGDLKKRNNILAKFRWSLHDKTALQGLLAELTALNDGLEHLLPRKEALILSRGLAGEILSTMPALPQVDEHSFGLDNSKTARIVQLRQQNRTSIAEEQPSRLDFASSIPTPFNDTATATPKDAWEIPITSFRDFREPRLKDILSHDDDYIDERRRIVDAPDVRSIYYYTRSNSTEPQQGEHVLVEWRSQWAESKDSKITPQALAERRKHLANLLHRTSVVDPEFRVLNCLGYTLASGRLPDGGQHPIVGFVYELPIQSTDTKPHAPASLREILGAAFKSENPRVPDLDDRFQLAQKLSLALYQLHCAGWIHRKISSHNILYFQDPESKDFDVTKFYICGWQYARPDHHIKATNSEKVGITEGSRAGELGDLAMYVHPDRLLGAQKDMPRFRKSYDIYSFGVVMIEIAFWEPALVFADHKDRTKMESFQVYKSRPHQGWRETLVKATENEIGAEMGSSYRTAVLNCLNGLRSSNQEDKDLAPDDMNSLEPGIEKEFFWEVVEELRRSTLS